MDLKKYIQSHCAFPKKVKIWDSKLMQYTYREVPCGHCLHCRMTKMNEWVTRLYAQQKYSKNTYYITLDYAPFNLSYSSAQLLAAETAAVENDLNINHSKGLQPILLCRNHLDDFYKRLRKKGFTFQYFSCGEYGSYWSRPHFHIILFTDDLITINDIQSAWSIDGYNIGRVDFHDLVANGTTQVNKKGNKYSSKYVFKYVCKYLMKGDFDFEKLKTLEYHKSYFNSLQKYYEKTDTLFPELVQITDSKLLEENWKLYCKKFSPFISCSRRPAIGLQYLQENVERFKTADFRLFGLSKDCSIFPRYFLRKTKEYVCGISALGKISKCPTTSSRLPFIISCLRSILDSRFDISAFDDSSAVRWYYDIKEHKLKYVQTDSNSFDNIDLSFYSAPDKFMFIFNGYDYTIWQKSKGFYFKICDLDVNSVLKYLDSESAEYRLIFIDKIHEQRLYNEKQLNDQIYSIYDNFDDFKKDVYKYYLDELKSKKRTDIEIINSHVLF